MKCRVIYKQDGTVSVIHPALKARRNDETMDAFLARVFEKAMSAPGFTGLDHDDVDVATLPVGDRGKWRGAKGQGVWVDNSVVTPRERRQAVETALDRELAKPNPDTVEVVRLRRKLEKGDF